MNAHSLDLEKKKNRRRTRLYIDAMAEMPLSIDVVDERHVLVVVVIVIMLVCRGCESWNPVSALHSAPQRVGDTFSPIYSPSRSTFNANVANRIQDTGFLSRNPHRSSLSLVFSPHPLTLGLGWSSLSSSSSWHSIGHQVSCFLLQAPLISGSQPQALDPSSTRAIQGEYNVSIAVTQRLSIYHPTTHANRDLIQAIVVYSR